MSKIVTIPKGQPKSHQVEIKELRDWLESDRIKSGMPQRIYNYFDRNITMLERPEPETLNQFHLRLLKERNLPPEKYIRELLRHRGTKK